ncbi:unnamed protein product [Trifolium pratense]|uniref:Uncharacterized protein n=1 Tax=Trifolium pratense TaxID=57577 RepID=A0ACB0JPP3_TRIPR|nr:unnamed protein product [Trifolium pratense]
MVTCKCNQTYNHDDSGSSMNNWGAPVAPGVGYAPIPPTAPHRRFPGPGHPPTIPPNGAPYSLSTVATIHHTAAFSADAYGVSGVPERPKKAPVPNWLREEIKKTVIVAPSADHPKVEQTLVTDELFDEIATKVLSEDNLPAEGPANYGSDADDEIESSNVPAPAKDVAYMVNNIVKTNSSLSRNSNGDAIDQLHDAKMTEESDHSDSKIVYKDARDNGFDAIERSHTRFNGYSSKDMSGVPMRLNKNSFFVSSSRNE